MPRTSKAIVGAADHCGWAILITVAREGYVIDRRRVELVDDALPKLPHHHECQELPLDEAVALIERVQRSAASCAQACLAALAATTAVSGIAIRSCPSLPASVAERISNYRAQNVADSVMYRDALARAAEARGWSVHWYDPKCVFEDAANAMGKDNIDDLIEKARTTLGPPWQKDHRMAMAAAIAAQRA